MTAPFEGAALVTGGAKRLGAAIVRSLSQAGFPVVIHHRASPGEAESLAAELRAQGGVAHVLAADLADPAAVESLIARAEALAGPIGVLVNNASRFEFDSAASVTAGSIAAHMAPNLAAPVLLARDMAARIGGRQGVIVNLLDQKLANLNPDFFAYTLSKAALAAATEMLAMALAPAIRVCGVAPGLTLIAAKQSEENFRRGQSATPLRRGSQPEDIARAVRFIVETPSVTGTTLYVDAGEHLMRRQRDVSFNAG
ncbi:SDR family oxidoreductase [Acidiphilium sp.]|uniref:SDR family oxidoreductase n=1 Tax=Acidiphilium sp. TaxID=527 RepID=UPI00258DC088|nr:SDR family oxidoreductase [Acidiphilium sp.]